MIYRVWDTSQLVGNGISEPSTVLAERCFHDAWMQQKPESYPMIPLGRSLKDPVSKMTAVGCVTCNPILASCRFFPSDSDNYLQGREKEHHDAWCFFASRKV